MRKKFDQVYQFKVALRGVRPPIWRRIQVPSTYTFWDLHVAIQDAMGWEDCHLHEFTMPHPESGEERHIGLPDPDWRPEVLVDRRQKIGDWFSLENRRAEYIYDFGDGWQHTVKLEKILPREPGMQYPRCIAGKRACPPEDCGGIGGYAEIVAGESESQEEFADYDPEQFTPAEVWFDDPDRC
jgi:hypothetical protein